MPQFFSPEIVSLAFKRLSSRKREGKAHLERTSALMYFFAVDAACKSLNVPSLDMNPDSLIGKNNRKQVELEFTKLVLVCSVPDGISQVIELGKIEFGGTSPEKRISSNFFTVPLKKASSQKNPYFYPGRPKAPLLMMGQSATGMQWGIQYHENWEMNFPRLLTEIREATPHLDLAIFLARDQPIDKSVSILQEAVKIGLSNIFSKNIVEYFEKKISQESMFARHINKPFVDHYAQFSKIYRNEPSTKICYVAMNKSELISRIVNLENLLKSNGIIF
ncbi:hypothetical protein [Sneathiella sp.]|uniref:hypothetical protein n=1 Tax=Sneathiella sp. TaxID=1964365 RepID=UPI0035663149